MNPTPRELEFVEEVLDMLVQGVHITAHHLNPAQGYVLTCAGDQGDYVTVNHYGFGGTSGPWTPELASVRFREQRILLGGEQ